ncbi:MFS transporter [Paenibacillus mucilaginosus]|uniref:Major facilitator superfamily transporter n=2 Tax=Paenibacillus mucilaginosus TaxID=61624 RepID=H6NLF0_9BACL|nr:MFS transporter [Paenibacillus mucilaginosus]AEI41832.1 major facilitator superfamily transporter MFS_1 [Paenibacillus mucilaginosus KNP414]AFC30332.1 major facilitator superfamily transporter [Paenibacillus mucilaginosus 3016]MCG7214513.1 MFS transporter [Paenibacillus mucilaginosus]WDM30794.1 MFS transporter [Paenibacillus mucilaginosus]WFA18967.1 MFS transporter [Paenibacillus mucilaginosus]
MSRLEVLQDPKQRKLLFSAGLSWLFDAMDIGLISFIAAAVAVQWQLTPQQVGLFTSINSIGMVIGAALAGLLADRFGRKPVLLWTLLLFSAASGLSALATGFAALCILRLIAGIGLGGELPVASTLVSESVPARERGRAVVLLESFWAGGWLAAALIAYFVIPKYGWQAGFVIGAVPALYALYLRRAIEEPPRFTARSRTQRTSFGERFASVWAPEHRRSTIMLWILWFTVVFSYYGMFLWLPSVMMLKGFTLVKSFQYVLLMTIAQLPGYFTAAYFIEKFGRKFVIVAYLLLTALSAIWFGNAETEGMLLAAGFCLSFFNLGAWGGLYAYTPELYPTSVRSTGVGLAASFGRIGGVIAPFLVGMLVARSVGIPAIFAIFFAAIVVGAIAVFFLGTETKGRELTE